MAARTDRGVVVIVTGAVLLLSSGFGCGPLTTWNYSGPPPLAPPWHSANGSSG